MRFGNCVLTGEMFVGRNLIGQLVLFDAASVTGRLRRPGRVLANLVLEVVRH
ncbi:MAG: hypothetical protein WBD31_24590 [Rubripirellula sp.]